MEDFKRSQLQFLLAGVLVCRVKDEPINAELEVGLAVVEAFRCSAHIDREAGKRNEETCTRQDKFLVLSVKSNASNEED